MKVFNKRFTLIDFSIISLMFISMLTLPKEESLHIMYLLISWGKTNRKKKKCTK